VDAPREEWGETWTPGLHPRQSCTSEMRTDESYPEDDASELTEWNGYILDSSLDEVSSEDPLPSPLINS
jgi:hypothetical protein